MAACQVIQKHGDADVALSKYRIIYGRKPECAQVWNNIGMCFFSKRKFVAAVSCLKRANYLAPFELYILYNLALVHLYLQQNASAAIFLQSAIHIHRKHAPSYALLGIALSKLNDQENASRAYELALKYDPTDPVTLLNYAIFQTNQGVSKSKIDSTLQQFHQFYSERAASATNQRELDTSMLDIATKLGGEVPQPPPPTTNIEQPLSTGKTYEIQSNDDEVVVKGVIQDDEQEAAPLPVVKTKIFDDGRHRQRRGKQQANGDSTQNDFL